MKISLCRALLVMILGLLAFTTSLAQPTDPLPSWNEGKSKRSIMEFVAKVTKLVEASAKVWNRGRYEK